MVTERLAGVQANNASGLSATEQPKTDLSDGFDVQGLSIAIVNGLPMIIRPKTAYPQELDDCDRRTPRITAREADGVTSLPPTFTCYTSDHFSQTMLRTRETCPYSSIVEINSPVAGTVLVSNTRKNRGAVIVTDFDSPAAIATMLPDAGGLSSIHSKGIGWSLNYESPLKFNDVFKDRRSLTAVLVVRPDEKPESVTHMQDNLLKTFGRVITIPAGEEGDARYTSWAVTFDAQSNELRVHSGNSDQFFAFNFEPSPSTDTKSSKSTYRQYLEYLDVDGRVSYETFRDIIELSPEGITKKYPSDHRLILRSKAELSEEEKIMEIQDWKSRAIKMDGYKFRLNSRIARNQTNDTEQRTGIELTSEQRNLFYKFRLIAAPHGEHIYMYGYIPPAPEDNNAGEGRQFVDPIHLNQFELLREVFRITRDYENWAVLDRWVEEKYPPYTTAANENTSSCGEASLTRSISSF